MKDMFKPFYVFIIAVLSTFQFYGQLRTDYDKTVDFTKYKTMTFLGWQDNSDQLINDLDKDRLHTSLGQEFRDRNLTFVKEGGELAVSLYLVIDQKTSRTAYTNYTGGMGYGGRWGYGYGIGYGGMGMGSSTTTVQEYDYEVGTFIISVYDSASKKLVWQAISKGTINDNPKRRAKTIPKSMKKIMKKYPVEAPR